MSAGHDGTPPIWTGDATQHTSLTEERRIKPRVLALLRRVEREDMTGAGIPLVYTVARRDAVALKLLEGRPMRCGHRKRYSLTNAGRKAVAQ